MWKSTSALMSSEATLCRSAEAVFGHTLSHMPFKMVKRSIILSSLAFIFLSTGVVAAQDEAGRTNGAAESQEAARESERMMRGRTLLDAPVSRTTYLLGPGDILELSLVGGINRQAPIPITPEGTIVLPGIGIVDVLGINVNQAQARVQSEVARFYRNTTAYLTLAEVRSFKIYVLGNTKSPGMRIASATTRVSEVIPQDAPRSVMIRRPSGDSISVDLRRFAQFGDLNHNPLLREGDIVVIPPNNHTVEVFGRVNFPGSYGYRTGETLAQMIDLANGGHPFPAEAADTIYVTRFISDQRRETYAFSRTEALNSKGTQFTLQPFDAVFVPHLANFRQQRTADVTGQVERPGRYPIEPGVTRVCELVEMAGGFTPEASLLNATLRRTPADQEAASTGWRSLENIPQEYLSAVDRRILRTRAQGDETNVVVNFRDISARNANACFQTVEADDHLSIPRHREEVVVLGAVAQPGVLRHVDDMQVAGLIQMAGGYTRQANRRGVVVLRSKLGTRLDAREVTTLQPGDMVIVPFREPRTWTESWVGISSVATSIVGLTLAIITAVR
jgi:protein involved in polysaccharide export with SLBB domain